MGERAYSYAKACGITGKSFIGKRVRSLERVGRLTELDSMVFPESPGNLPEKELLLDLEKRIISRSVQSIISIVDCFSKPAEFLLLLIRGYEYADLLNALNAYMEKDKSAPAYTNLGRFQTVRFKAWPDVKAMIQGTAFDFLLSDSILPDFSNEKKSIPKVEHGDKTKRSFSLQSLLDKHYYNALWCSLFSLPARDRNAAVRILSEEISLKNCSWVLRLRTYYGMSSDEVKTHLVDIPEGGKKNQGKSRRSLAKDALECLEFPLDNFSAWSSWRWKELLNPLSGARQWHADPRHFQNAASRHLYHLARQFFRANPSSLDSIYCFIKLKQFEEDVLTSSAEGLSVGMSGRDVLSMLGVEP
jgi:vacuolar-type H+-ATPase subunit C/Vma6